MIKTLSKKSWTIFISIMAASGSIALACADAWWPEYGNSSFTPEAFVEKKYSPFFYSEMYYYGINHDESHNTRFNESNVNDWSAYFDNKIAPGELDYLLSQASSRTADSIAVFFNGKYASLPESVQTYLWLKNKKDNKIKAFINYLALAKESEKFAVNYYYYWDNEPKKTAPYERAASLNNALQQGFNNTSDPFLKQRYWFQLVRSAFFNGGAQSAIDLFEMHESKFSKNDLYYRAMAYAAGNYYRRKNYSRANYYYSLVYNGCDKLKTVAHYSFHPQEETDWQATLALCKNKEERITLWQMLGVFYSDEKRAIREIYQLDPSSAKLNLLLARAINKEEQKISVGSDSKGMTVVGADPALFSMVTGIADTAKTGDPFMWFTAAGYLQMLYGNFDKATTYYRQAEKNSSNEPLRQWQLRLLKLMNKTASAIKVDNKLEKEMQADIEWLRTFKEDENLSLRYSDAFAFIKHNMAGKYSRQREYVKSECFVSKSSFYGDNANVEALKSFLIKTGKTPWEQLCRNLYEHELNDLYEYQAIRFAFEDKLSDAITLLEKAGDRSNSPLLGNPFNGRIQDCHDCDHTSYKGTPYTKMSLLKKMKEMKDNVEKGTDVYNNALLLGNAHYNLSHYGNARYFYESAILGSGHNSPFSIDDGFRNLLTNMKTASAYYQKALAAATNHEQKAKCHYLLAKCERNEWYNQHVYNGDNDYSGQHPLDLDAMTNFKALEQYADTKYYQEVIKECGYFNTFIKKTNGQR